MGEYTIRLYYALDKLFTAYCTVLAHEDFTGGLTGEEIDEICDLLIEMEDD